MNQASRDDAHSDRPYERLTDVLRRRIADGAYPLGVHLPPQRELAREFGVSRDSVQRAMKVLSNEGWVQLRQGSGARVARPLRGARVDGRSPTLGPHVTAAFESPIVTIDVFTLTSESLDAHVRVQEERIRAREAHPESITVRLLLPRIDGDFKLARAVSDAEDRRAIERLSEVAARHTASIRGSLQGLQKEGLVPNLQFEHRESPVAPMQKLYLLNGTELLSAYYTVARRPLLIETAETEEEIEIYDTFGLAATLHHHSAASQHPDPEHVAIINRARQWYEHAWANAATPSTAD